MRPRRLPGPPPSGIATSGESTVKGRVVYKDNGQPLKATRVRIFTSDDSGLVAFTNDRGEFRVGNLAAGKYYVALEGPGVAMQSGFGMRLPLPINAIPRKEDYEEIIPKHDAEFTVDGTNTVEVEVKVPRGGTISGKVMKPNGAAVANVPVSFISREGRENGPYTSRFSTQTDQDGFYKINNVPEGDYIVATVIEDKSVGVDIRARIRGETQIVTYHPSATTARDAVSVRVDPGRETGGVNITLLPRNSFKVSGTVIQQRDGTSLAGATVLLRNKDTEISGSLLPGMAQRTTRADADGRWTFSNVMEGEYVVTALAPRPRAARLPQDEPADREQAFRESRMRFLVAQQEIVVAGADLSGLTMEISGPGSIVGSIQTDNGAPLPSNLVIFVELVSKTSRPGPPMPVRVRPDGSFVMDGVQSGETFIAIALPPGAKAFIKSVTANGDDLQRSALKVMEGAEAGPVQVVISAGVGSLTGRLLSKNGDQGVSDFVILLAPVEPEKQRFRTNYLTSRTGADGSFSVTGAPGEYLVIAKRRDDLPGIVTEEFVRAQAAQAVRVTLATGEQKRVDLRPN